MGEVALSTIFPGIIDFYNRVRTVLGVDAAVLENQTIDRFEYSGIAKMYVDEKISSAAGFTTEQTEILNCCYIYKTAIELLPILKGEKDVKLEQTTHSKKEYFKDSFDDILDILSEKLSTYLNMLGYSSEYTPTIFTTSNTDDVYEGDTYHI